tara:strand:- start:573 stop:872 length:300 start_codon:yes stop_codon:yes gene_type:complete
MTFSNDRASIFPGRVTSHRGKTITDIGSSTAYLSFLKQQSKATNYSVAIVPNDMEGRPDLLSYAAYGTEVMWWLIVEANSIYDYETDLKAGTQIIIPKL